MGFEEFSEQTDEGLLNKNCSNNHADNSVVGHVEFPSIVDIKKALPKHCFEPKLLVSLYFILLDFSIIIALYGSLLLVESHGPTWLMIVLTPVYWYVQGTLFASIFILGHDCGHDSFSNYQLLNDVIGTLLHGFILVPYYPWKLSHRNHHKNTGNVDRDEVFYPVREKDMYRTESLMVPGFGLGLGWIHYIFNGYRSRHVNHFNPFDAMFAGREFWCVTSCVAVISMAYCAFFYSQQVGVWLMLSHYLIPVFVFASWLVLITFLHHHDIDLPWYGDKLWSNVKGQLSSVDRHYGWAHGVLHNIGTHQIHHLFPKIPHYYLEDATAAFQKTFPHLVRKNDDSIFPAFWKMFYLFEKQKFIGDHVDYHVYKNI